MAGVVETVGLVGASMLLREEDRSFGRRCAVKLVPKAVVGVVATDGVTEPGLCRVGVGGPAKRIVWRSLTSASDGEDWMGDIIWSELRRTWRVEVGELEPEASLGVFGGGMFHPIGR